MNQNYTQAAEQAVRLAEQYAREKKAAYLGTEHLLYGLYQEKSTVGDLLRECFSVDSFDLLLEVMASSDSHKKKLTYTPELQAVLEEAKRLSDSMHMEKTGTGHMLLAILRRKDCIAGRQIIQRRPHRHGPFERGNQATGRSGEGLLKGQSRRFRILFGPDRARGRRTS